MFVNTFIFVKSVLNFKTFTQVTMKAVVMIICLYAFNKLTTQKSMNQKGGKMKMVLCIQTVTFKEDNENITIPPIYAEPSYYRGDNSPRFSIRKIFQANPELGQKCS